MDAISYVSCTRPSPRTFKCARLQESVSSVRVDELERVVYVPKLGGAVSPARLSAFERWLESSGGGFRMLALSFIYGPQMVPISYTSVLSCRTTCRQLLSRETGHEARRRAMTPFNAQNGSRRVTRVAFVDRNALLLLLLLPVLGRL